MSVQRDLSAAVVICAYDERRWDSILSAVDSVRGQTTTPAEVVLVVDHNPQLLERAAAELVGVQAIPNNGERGLGEARNRGVEASVSGVIAFLDDDALAERTWLERLLAAYEDPAVIAAGGWIEPMWEEGRPLWYPEEFDWTVGCTYRGVPVTTSVVRNLHGCNMSFRREAFIRAGVFRLGYGCDETEFCIRLSRCFPERRIVYTPSARVHHRVPAHRARVSHFLRRCYFEGGSKAVVSWLWGSGQGLSAERRYVARTLPAGVVSALAAAVRYRRPQHAGRAFAIVGGLAATAAGYAHGRLTVERAARARGLDGHEQSRDLPGRER